MTYRSRTVRAGRGKFHREAANLQLSNTEVTEATIAIVMTPPHSPARRFRTCTFRDPTWLAATQQARAEADKWAPERQPLGTPKCLGRKMQGTDISILADENWGAKGNPVLILIDLYL